MTDTLPRPTFVDGPPNKKAELPTLTRKDFQGMLAGLGVTLAIRQGEFLRKHEIPYQVANEHLLLANNIDAIRFWLPERPNNFADCYFLPGLAMPIMHPASAEPAHVYGLYVHYTLNEALPESIGDPKDLPPEVPVRHIPPFHRGNFLQFQYGNSAAAMNLAAKAIWRFFLDRQFHDMGALFGLEDQISFPVDLNTQGEIYQVNTTFVPTPQPTGPTPEYVARFKREQERILTKLERQEAQQLPHPPEDSI